MQPGESDAEKLHGAMEVGCLSFKSIHNFLFQISSLMVMIIKYFRALVRMKMFLPIFYVVVPSRYV